MLQGGAMSSQLPPTPHDPAFPCRPELGISQREAARPRCYQFMSQFHSQPGILWPELEGLNLGGRATAEAQGSTAFCKVALPFGMFQIKGILSHMLHSKVKVRPFLPSWATSSKLLNHSTPQLVQLQKGGNDTS